MSRIITASSYLSRAWAMSKGVNKRQATQNATRFEVKFYICLYMLYCEASFVNICPASLNNNIISNLHTKNQGLLQSKKKMVFWPPTDAWWLKKGGSKLEMSSATE